MLSYKNKYKLYVWIIIIVYLVSMVISHITLYLYNREFYHQMIKYTLKDVLLLLYLLMFTFFTIFMLVLISILLTKTK
jgi:hypothetical protein